MPRIFISNLNGFWGFPHKPNVGGQFVLPVPFRPLMMSLKGTITDVQCLMCIMMGRCALSTYLVVPYTYLSIC